MLLIPRRHDVASNWLTHSCLALWVMGTLATTATAAEESTITVVGDAVVKVAPDYATISVGIDSQAKTVAEAKQDNDKRVKAINEFLKENGVKDRDICPEYISISPHVVSNQQYANGGYSKKGGAANQIPQYQQQEDPFGGPGDFDGSNASRNGRRENEPQTQYLVSRRLSIHITSLEKFESIYQGIIERDVSRIDQVQFLNSESRKHKEAARLEAVRIAKTRAKGMAGELGADLSAVKTIREAGSSASGYGRGGFPSADPFSDAPDSETPNVPRQIAITSNVEIVFILTDAKL